MFDIVYPTNSDYRLNETCIRSLFHNNVLIERNRRYKTPVGYSCHTKGSLKIKSLMENFFI